MTVPTSVNVGISYESALDESKIHVVTMSSKKKAAGFKATPPLSSGTTIHQKGMQNASMTFKATTTARDKHQSCSLKRE